MFFFTPRSSEPVVLSSARGWGLHCNRSPRVLSWGPGSWSGLGSRAGQPQEGLVAGGRLRVQSCGPLVRMELGIWSEWSWGSVVQHSVQDCRS